VLTELRVRDLGVIEDLSLTFTDGMTVLTGETGAGKTLLVEALQLVLGERASTGLVRAGSAEALVEARFTTDDGEILLARAVPASGRSRAWVDGRMAPVGARDLRGFVTKNGACTLPSVGVSCDRRRVSDIRYSSARPSDRRGKVRVSLLRSEYAIMGERPLPRRGLGRWFAIASG